ncbi:MAG TPA: rhodanese-like domain-containing protein [Anaerolineaceae bacterium]|nr:rhodanese-like domain-containing protein [Anaerolineaceae bacterium]
MSKKQSRTNTKMNSTQLLLIGLAVVALIVLAVVLAIGNKGQGTSLPATINVTDADQRFKAGAFLLDVREPSEWEAGHVEGAVLIPLGQLQSRISELPADRDILIICRSGNRSGQARDLLRAAGLKRTTSVGGGMNAWSAAGLPVVTGN